MIPKIKVGAAGPHAAGDIVPLAGGQEGELLASLLHGDLFQSTHRGRMFMLSTVATGLAIPVYTTTTPNLVLWNPSGSGKLAVMLEYRLGYVSGNTLAGAIGMAYIRGAGANIGTGATFSAFTQNDPVNGIVGEGAASVMRTTSSAATLTTAGTWFTSLGLSNYDKPTAAATSMTVFDFHGGLIVVPGTAIYLVASAASVGLYAQTLVWEEDPARVLL